MIVDGFPVIEGEENIKNYMKYFQINAKKIQEYLETQKMI